MLGPSYTGPGPYILVQDSIILALVWSGLAGSGLVWPGGSGLAGSGLGLVGSVWSGSGRVCLGPGLSGLGLSGPGSGLGLSGPGSGLGPVWSSLVWVWVRSGLGWSEATRGHGREEGGGAAAPPSDDRAGPMTPPVTGLECPDPSRPRLWEG